MKQIIHTLNATFLTIILTFFYLVVIGIAKILHTLGRKTNKTTNSFWEKPVLEHDFNSSY